MEVLDEVCLELVRGGLEVKQSIYCLSKEEVFLLIQKGCVVIYIGQVDNGLDCLYSVFDKDFSPVYEYEMENYLSCELE